MSKLYNLFYQRLPVRSVSADQHLDLLNEAEIKQIRRSHRVLIAAAISLAVLGFLSYYLPIWWHPQYFPSAKVTLPVFGMVTIKWGELLWCLLLSMIELYLLVLLNIAGVHEIAVATGFINPETKNEKGEVLLGVGLEKKSRDVTRYGIDPFQGMNKWALFLFNLVLRLKGWLGNQAIRYLLRLLLGRYAVRELLDLSGMPLYMMINALAIHTVLREARVIIMGQAIIRSLIERLPEGGLSDSDKELLYDTLQYIAISKRDFHENHFLLAKHLLEFFSIPLDQNHHLPDDYLEKLKNAPDNIKAVCQMIILLGFILDGQVSRRERVRIDSLNRSGILRESYEDVKRYSSDFHNGRGIKSWSEVYLSRINFAGWAYL